MLLRLTHSEFLAYSGPGRVHIDLTGAFRHLSKLETAYQSILTSRSAPELRDAWESYLESFSKTIGQLISNGIKHTVSKPWAYQLKNSSTKTDEGLVYLREARNEHEHGPSFAQFGQFRPASVNTPFGELDGSGKFSMTGAVYIDGNEVFTSGNLSMQLDRGIIKNMEGVPEMPFAQQRSTVTLKPVTSMEKKKTFPVPKSLGGERTDVREPQELAGAGLEFLVRRFKELDDLLNSES